MKCSLYNYYALTLTIIPLFDFFLLGTLLQCLCKKGHEFDNVKEIFLILSSLCIEKLII